MTLFNSDERKLAVRAITNDKTGFPDIVCLQEVESLLALRRFNEDHLQRQYRYALLIDSRDFRQIDVGFPEVTPGSYASDHCPVFFDLPWHAPRTPA